MRRLLIGLVLLTLAVAGCGSSSSPSTSDIRNTELSYFPSRTLFVMSIVTDPNSAAVKQAEALAGTSPLTAFGESALLAKLQQVGIDYQGDIRPLFGNPIMFGIPGSTLSGSATSNFLAVWIAKDSSKLGALLKKLGLHSAGSHDGATLYGSGGATNLAVDGATVLFAPSASALNSALDLHAHGGGISSAQSSQAFAGLSQTALIEIFGNLTQVLAAASSGNAHLVPWVGAFRGYAASVSTGSSGLTIQFRLDTTGAPLTAAQLPFATGTTAPSLAGPLPIIVGIHDPAQLFSFAEAAEQATSPASYARFLKRQAAVRAKTGVDLSSLLQLLTGDLIIASDTHTTMGRAAVSDPAAAAQTVSKLATSPRSVFRKAISVTKLGGGFYSIKESRTTTITVGVVGSELVAGKATPAQLSAFAAAPASPATGAQGTVAFRVALVDLLRLPFKSSPPQSVLAILNTLGDITGWSAASPSGITGSATLAVK